MTKKNKLNKSDGYYLVTTANENSWDASKKMLFLGEWCCDYSKKNEIADLDYSVATPFCSSSFEKKESLDFVAKKTKHMLVYAREILNRYHGTSHESRYWNIVLGHWLQSYVSVIYNRYFTLQKALQNYNITETATVSYKSYNLVTQVSIDLHSAVDNDKWNMVLYDMLLNIINPPSILHSNTIKLYIDRDYLLVRKKKNKGIKWLVRFIIHSSLKHFVRDSDSLIIVTYLGKISEAILKLKLFEAPSFEMDPEGISLSFSIDEKSRDELTPTIDSPSDFDDVLKMMFMNLLPTCFLEGYKEYIRSIDQTGWPKHPKFIFTSNAFLENENFKLYTAKHSEEGVPYFVGQHGNAYGTHIEAIYYPEIATADKFFSWGWSDNINNVVPAFAFNKYMFGKKIKRDKNGMLLLVEGARTPLILPYDTTSEHSYYQSEQFKFVKSLECDIRDHLLVRLYAHHINLPWHDKLRWRDELPDVRLENGNHPFMSLVKRSRIAIFSYDSTGLLQFLALNLPFVCFWRGGTSHIQDTAKYYYELLREVNIYHDNPESAAQKVNEVWDDIDGWWGQSRVQDARMQFCDRYARVSQHPVQDLKKILTANN